MKKSLLLLLVSIFLLSCESEKNIIRENTDVPLISEVLMSGEPYYVYTYSVSNLISEEKSKFHYTKHNYNDKNQLVSSDYYYDPAMFSSSSFVAQSALKRKEWLDPDNLDVSLTKKYEYEDDGRLIRVRYIRPAPVNTEYTEFVIENGLIRRQSMYWQDALSHYVDYTYDTRGNLLKAAKYRVSGGETKLLTVNEYEYDDMRNPYQSFRRLITPGKFTNPNNIIKEIYRGSPEVEPFVSEYSYEYNYLGYPVKVNGETEYVYRW